MTKFYPFAVLIVLAGFLVTIVTAGGSIQQFLSLPALLLVVLPALVLSLATCSVGELGHCFAIVFRRSRASRTDLLHARGLFRAIARYFIASGVFGFILGTIVLLSNLNGDPTVIGAGTALALLTILYSIGLYLVVPVPYLTAIGRKLADLNADR